MRVFEFSIVTAKNSRYQRAAFSPPAATIAGTTGLAAAEATVLDWKGRRTSSDINCPHFNTVNRFELVLPFMPEARCAEEDVAVFRIGTFVRKLLKVLGELSVVCWMDGGERFSGDEVWDHARERKESGLSGRPSPISRRFESSVQYSSANRCDAVRSARRPAHALLLGHASIGDFVHAAFRTRG